jgi:hypothetical protein
MPNFRNSTQSTITAADGAVTLAYRQFFNGGIGVQVTGTFSATLSFEMSIDGTNFVSVLATNVNSGGIATTTTATGIYKFDVVGALVVRVRASAYTSGTATVTVVGMAG